MSRNRPVSSAERPHLQLHDAEVVRFRQAAVVEGVAGAAAAHVQALIHPQPEVTTEDRSTDLGKGLLRGNIRYFCAFRFDTQLLLLSCL